MTEHSQTAAAAGDSEVSPARFQALKDLAKTDFGHKFHQPKPPIGELAAMQGAITQSFAKRYTPKTVEAIEALLSAGPDLDAIRAGIRALGFEDLWGISDALDRAMNAAERERGFHPWLPPADKARAASRAPEDLGNDEL